MFRWMLLIAFTFFTTACDAPDEAARPTSSMLNKSATGQEVMTSGLPSFEPLTATSLLNEPTSVHRFESTAEALTVWRRAAKERPTLLLLSNNPHLRPVPEELRTKAAILANNAILKNIQLAATARNPSPLIMPGMSVDIALRSGWFRDLAWALPLRDPAQGLDLEKFKGQLGGSGIATDDEVETVVLNERIFDGTLRGTPFRAAALPLIKGLTGPVIVHIDLSYFQPIYKNEIATPLLDIVHQTLITLQKMQLETLAVTLSYGHLDSQIALDVRFLGEIISALIEEPAKLDEAIPVNWQRQRDALYLANFFQKEKIRELYEAQEQEAPEKAWVKFNLYRSAAEHKQGTEALDYLAQAVALDPMYALEYQELSAVAYEKNRPDEALRMLGLAAEVFHHDPFLKLQMAQLANELGQQEMALELLNKIRNLVWSQTYYPDMPRHLKDLTAYVQNGPQAADNAALQEKTDDQPFELVIPDAEQ